VIRALVLNACLAPAAALAQRNSERHAMIARGEKPARLNVRDNSFDVRFRGSRLPFLVGLVRSE
jgi:hypothetical protein